MQSQGGHLKETKMEVQKWVLKSSPTLAAVVMAFSCMAVSASAAETATCNNHDDTAFSFAFSDWGRSNTTGRSKTDTSGTYIIANTICNGGFDVYVDGYDSNAGEWVDCTDKTTRGQPHLKTTNNPVLSANGFMKTDTARHVLAVTSGDQIEALPVCGALILLAVTGILVPPRKPAKMIAKSANGKTVRRFCPINWF